MGLALVAGLGGCGGAKQQSSPTLEVQRLNGLEYGILEKGTLVPTATSVAGSGRVIFRDPRPNADSNYSTAFSLEEGGAVMLTTNADNRLGAGVNLSFAREKKVLKVVLAVGGESYDLSPNYTMVDAAKPVSVEVDVHGHGHAVVWLGGTKEQYAFKTRVAGSFWGLGLIKANVTRAVAGKPIEQH